MPACYASAFLSDTQGRVKTCVAAEGSPGGDYMRTGQAGAAFAAEPRQGRPSQQADARPLPSPVTAYSPTSTSGREVAELRQQIADLQGQNRQLLHLTKQQQATITSLQVRCGNLSFPTSHTPLYFLLPVACMPSQAFPAQKCLDSLLSE